MIQYSQPTQDFLLGRQIKAFAPLVEVHLSADDVRRISWNLIKAVDSPDQQTYYPWLGADLDWKRAIGLKDDKARFSLLNREVEFPDGTVRPVWDGVGDLRGRKVSIKVWLKDAPDQSESTFAAWTGQITKPVKERGEIKCEAEFMHFILKRPGLPEISRSCLNLFPGDDFENILNVRRFGCLYDPPRGFGGPDPYVTGLATGGTSATVKVDAPVRARLSLITDEMIESGKALAMNLATKACRPISAIDRANGIITIEGHWKIELLDGSDAPAALDDGQNPLPRSPNSAPQSGDRIVLGPRASECDGSLGRCRQLLMGGPNGITLGAPLQARADLPYVDLDFRVAVGDESTASKIDKALRLTNFRSSGPQGADALTGKPVRIGFGRCQIKSPEASLTLEAGKEERFRAMEATLAWGAAYAIEGLGGGKADVLNTPKWRGFQVDDGAEKGFADDGAHLFGFESPTGSFSASNNNKHWVTRGLMTEEERLLLIGQREAYGVNSRTWFDGYHAPVAGELRDRGVPYLFNNEHGVITHRARTLRWRVRIDLKDEKREDNEETKLTVQFLTITPPSGRAQGGTAYSINPGVATGYWHYCFAWGGFADEEVDEPDLVAEQAHHNEVVLHPSEDLGTLDSLIFKGPDDDGLSGPRNFVELLPQAAGDWNIARGALASIQVNSASPPVTVEKEVISAFKLDERGARWVIYFADDFDPDAAPTAGDRITVANLGQRGRYKLRGALEESETVLDRLVSISRHAAGHPIQTANGRVSMRSRRRQDLDQVSQDAFFTDAGLPEEHTCKDVAVEDLPESEYINSLKVEHLDDSTWDMNHFFVESHAGQRELGKAYRQASRRKESSDFRLGLASEDQAWILGNLYIAEFGGSLPPPLWAGKIRGKCPFELAALYDLLHVAPCYYKEGDPSLQYQWIEGLSFRASYSGGAAKLEASFEARPYHAGVWERIPRRTIRPRTAIKKPDSPVEEVAVTKAEDVSVTEAGGRRHIRIKLFFTPEGGPAGVISPQS